MSDRTLTWIVIEYENGTTVEGVGCQGLLLHNAVMTDYLVAANDGRTDDGNAIGRRGPDKQAVR